MFCDVMVSSKHLQTMKKVKIRWINCSQFSSEWESKNRLNWHNFPLSLRDSNLIFYAVDLKYFCKIFSQYLYKRKDYIIYRKGTKVNNTIDRGSWPTVKRLEPMIFKSKLPSTSSLVQSNSKPQRRISCRECVGELRAVDVVTTYRVDFRGWILTPY